MKQLSKKLSGLLIAFIARNKLLTTFITVIAVSTALSGVASAQSSFGDHLWKFANASGTNMIDFNKGKSKIYDNGNLHIVTDDFIYLNAPDTVFVQNNQQIGNTLKFVNNGVGHYTGSSITDNGQLHIATDDHMYLDAPSDVNVSNVLNVGSSASVYTDNTNHNCDPNDTAACVDLTPPSDGGKSAVFEFQGDPNTVGASESSGVALNSDTINMWSPGDAGILNVYDQDHFCPGYTLGEVGAGDGSGVSDPCAGSGTVGALFEIDGNGGVQAVGDSHFYGNLTVDGTLTADFSSFVDNNLSGVTGNFEVGTDSGGNLQVDGDINANGDISADGNITLGNDCGGCSLELAGGASTKYDYSNDGNQYWAQNVQDGAFILYNSFNDFNAMTVDENGNTTIEGPDRHATLDLANDGDLNVEGNSTLGSSHWDNLDVNATSTFENDVTINGETTVNQDIYLQNNSVLRSGISGCGYSGVEDAVCVGTSGDNNNFAVWGDTYLDGETIFGGRLYGAGHIDGVTTGDPVTIGRYNGDNPINHPGLTVWGTSTLKGDVTIGGDDTNWVSLQVQDPNGNTDFNVNTDDGYVQVGDSGNSIDFNLYGTQTIQDENWAFNAFQVLNPDGQRTFNVDNEFNRVSVGHWDTPTDLKVWGDTNLEGDLNVDGSITADSGTVYFSNDAEFGNYAYFDNGAEFDDNVDVYNNSNINLWEGSDLNINDNGNLYVDGTATINNLIVNESTAYGGTQTYNGAAIYNGGSTYNGSFHAVGAATFDNTVTLNSTVMGGNAANINFSGANSLRIPVVSLSITDGVTGCSNTGQMEFNTNDSHFYGCDGSVWQQLD